jgi:hypothetical protein
MVFDFKEDLKKKYILLKYSDMALRTKKIVVLLFSLSVDL